MSWLYSQALVEEYLGDISSDGEQSVPLNGNPTQQAYLSQDKMIKFSRVSRFGMTYKPLTENLGEELLKSYLGAFHVKTLVPLEKEKESQESDQVCGNTWQGSLAKYDLNTSSWKIAQCSLFEDLELSLETFPRWGSMRNGELFQREISVLPILESESGLSQQMWPTPTVGCVEGGEQSKQVEMTQMGSFITRRVNKPHMTYGAKLSDAVLFVEKKMWGTPKAQDSRHALRDRGKGNLGEQVSGLHNGGKLSHLWTEWLMGWPIGWTDLKPLEMDKSLYVQQQHGES